MEGFPFAADVHVRFAETDAQGIAHHATYLVWFEVARIDYLAEFTGGYRRIQDEGLEALTTEGFVKYARPAFFDDRLAIHTRMVDVRGARFRFDYAIERDGELLADGYTLHALVDAKTLRPIRMPAWLVEAVAAAEGRAG